MTGKQLFEKYKGEKSFLIQFEDLFCLKLFFSRCIIKEDYSVSEKFNDAIILSSKGQDLFKQLKEGKFKETSDSKINLAIFLEFYHDELLVDIEKTKSEILTQILHEQIISGQIIFPWIYGRLLYDKYFEEFEEQEEVLSSTDTQKLLLDTPKGIFQLGKMTVGPLGVIKTDYNRHIPPTRKIRLWHCSDNSCTAFHETYLNTSKTDLIEIQEEIDNILQSEKPSDWGELFFRLIDPENYYYDSDRLSDFPFLLINAFGKYELKKLLEEIINTNKEFRNLLPKEKKFAGAASTIVEGLTKYECFQLILLENDKTLIELIEKLIIKEEIIIPPTEIRRPKIRKARGFYSIYHECNRLGIRADSAKLEIGILRLNNLIDSIYQEPALRQQLEWKLKYENKETLKEKIASFTSKEEPRKIVKELVLSGPLQITQTFQKLFGYFAMPTNPQEEELLIDKILWKLGFNINIYPDYLEVFWSRLNSFKEIVRSCISFNEADKEKIRSAAVNLFVSLELILEQSLSFSTWLLLSDHYLNTNFKYHFEDSREFMCQKLNNYVLGSNDPLIFDSNGKNTLFPLVEGFTALIDICDKLLAEGLEINKRPENEQPSFYQKATITTFPFLSKYFFLDLKPSNYASVRNLLIEIPRNFNTQKVLSIRNKLQHKRDDFPNQVEILEACNAIEDGINKLEINGLYPNVYLFQSANTDKFNRRNLEFSDYKGRVIKIIPTTEFIGSKLPDLRSPQIIVPILNIGNSQELVRFKYEENSDYLKFWKNFPRKKVKANKNDENAH